MSARWSLRVQLLLSAACCGLLGVLVTASFVRLTQRGVIASSLGPTLGWLMEHGELTRCEADPQHWSLEAPNDGSVFAYAPDSLLSQNPNAPRLDAQTQKALRDEPGQALRVRLFGLGKGGLVLLRVRQSGPCGLAVVFWRSRVTRLSALTAIAFCGFVTGVLSAGLCFWSIVRPLARRIAAVSSAASQVGTAEGYQPHVEAPDDDLGRLARALDRAHARIRADAVELDARRQELQDHIADVAHDLRTPLASLQLTLQQAGRHAHDSTLRSELLSRALEDVVYVGGLIGNLRLASDLRHSWDPPPRTRVALGETLERSVLRLHFLAEQKGVSLEVATPDVPMYVSADPIALEQALVNVLENAVVHGSRGVQVAALLEQSGARFRLTIVDDGPGVPPEELPRLFERHFRSAQADARHARGSGLGLSITHEVCRRLGYQLTFSSNAPRGLCVTIEGPLDVER